jgi:hypothetical protein
MSSIFPLLIHPHSTPVNIERVGVRALSGRNFCCRLGDFILILSSVLYSGTAMSWTLYSHRRNYFHWHLSFLIPSFSYVCLLTNQSCQSHLSLKGGKNTYLTTVSYSSIFFVPDVCIPTHVCDTSVISKSLVKFSKKGISNSITLNLFSFW